MERRSDIRSTSKAARSTPPVPSALVAGFNAVAESVMVAWIGRRRISVARLQGLLDANQRLNSGQKVANIVGSNGLNLDVESVRDDTIILPNASNGGKVWDWLDAHSPQRLRKIGSKNELRDKWGVLEEIVQRGLAEIDAEKRRGAVQKEPDASEVAAIEASLAESDAE